MPAIQPIPKLIIFLLRNKNSIELNLHKFESVIVQYTKLLNLSLTPQHKSR